MTKFQELTFLLVDDDADDRDIFKMALSETGESVRLITAGDAEEALRWIDSTSELPHFIFLDLNMPRMSGTQCLIEMKKNVELVHTPIVVYSTSSAERDREAAVAAGAHAFFTKPSAIGELTDRLKRLLASHADSPVYTTASAR